MKKLLKKLSLLGNHYMPGRIQVVKKESTPAVELTLYWERQSNSVSNYTCSLC